MAIHEANADENSDAETETHRLSGLPKLSRSVTEAGLDGL